MKLEAAADYTVDFLLLRLAAAEAAAGAAAVRWSPLVLIEARIREEVEPREGIK